MERMPHESMHVASPMNSPIHDEKTLHQIHIEELTSRKIEAFQGTIDEHGKYKDEIYKSNRRMVGNLASDYRDRFLMELIQNAYDAHTEGTRDGRIEITLHKHRGKFGTLFIANMGSPFVEKDVSAICNTGLSQKPPGEAIGNKGLGFCSVIQITDSPKIYSQSPNSPNGGYFSGFCFRFAEKDDYPRLIKNSKKLELACRDLPIFHLPIWLDSRDSFIRRFAEDGFSTVIELPLRDANSLDAVQREVNDLKDQKVPMLLFLDRVLSLQFRSIDESESVETEFELTRSAEICRLPDMEISRANLGDAGLFLVCRRCIDEETMKSAIEEGINRKELHEHWENWSGDGEVAVAVRLDSVITSSRFYTFLPMGEQATAPFPGFLQGSFFPFSNRKNLNARIQLNSMLLNNATKLVAEVIQLITTNSLDQVYEWLTPNQCATAVVDLLCWCENDGLETDENFADLLAQLLTNNFGVSSFSEVPILPCLSNVSDSNAVVWQPPARARRWPDDTTVFSAKAATYFALDTNVWPIWSGLGSRLDLLEEFLYQFADEHEGEPSASERAQLVSLVARELNPNHRISQLDWLNYFQEIPGFMGCGGMHLAGLPVLLGNDNQLHNANSTEALKYSSKTRRRYRVKETAVFSPPNKLQISTDEEFDLKLPKKLSERFALLHTDFPWHDDLDATRAYLEEHDLIQKFDRGAVLTHLSRILQEGNDKRMLESGLRWAFQLWYQPRSHGHNFKMQSSHQFRVPTKNGRYVDAKETVFSGGWPDETMGSLLQEFLDTAPVDIADLQLIANHQLASPDHSAFRGKLIEDWVLFLSELGVNSGLTPKSMNSSKKRFPVHRLINFTFLKDFGIPSKFADFWRNDIFHRNPSSLEFDYSTEYVVEGKLWWLPGQADIDRFSLDCMELYAKLIFHWFSRELRDDIWNVQIHHQTYRHADCKTWPTPLNSFLRSARWLVAECPTRVGTNPISVPPSDIWINKTGSTRFFPYLRRLRHGLRSHLNRAQDQLIEVLSAKCGFHIFDDPSDLHNQLEFLAEQYTSEGFDRHFNNHLLNIYDDSWRLYAKHCNISMPSDTRLSPEKILVKKGPLRELVNMAVHDNNQDTSIIVYDTDGKCDQHLLEASGQPFLFFGDENAKRFGELFENLYGLRIRRLSQISFTLHIDGQGIEDCKAESVVNICPQLRAMLATAMEALSGTEAQRLPSDRAILLTRLDQLKIAQVNNLRFNIDGINVSPSQNSEDAFHFRLNNNQSIIVVQSTVEWSWELVDRCIPAICEALGTKALAPHLRLLVANLCAKDSLREYSSYPYEDVKLFSRILRLTSSASEAASASLSIGIERHVSSIKAVLHIFVGPPAVEKFEECSDHVLKDTSLLQEFLSDLLKNTSCSADRIIEISRTAMSSEDFREGLDIDFSDFNMSLESLGFEIVQYPSLHKARFENFIRENHIEIINRLRVSYAQQIENFQLVNDYARFRDSIENLEYDRTWLRNYKEPSEEIMISHVNSWLEERGAPRLDNSIDQIELEPLVQVREYNRKFIDGFLLKAIQIIRAWCAKYQVEYQLESSIAKNDLPKIIEQLYGNGVLDFRKLDDDSALKWLQVLEIWPSDMIVSLDLGVLGLSKEDLEEEKIKEQKEKEKRDRKARSFFFNGNLVDPIEANIVTLSEELRNNLSSEVMRKTLNSMPDLVDTKQTKSPTKKPKNKSPSNSRIQRFPEKTELIGQLGELAVYYWLQNILPKQDIDVAWKSKISTLFTNRVGDDELGYDFEVSYNRQIWQIEVKARLNDPQNFELGETEVRAAQKAARPRSRVQYKIAYVSNVTDPSVTNIEMLPNPMTEEGERVLQLRGQGIHYGFNRN